MHSLQIYLSIYFKLNQVIQVIYIMTVLIFHYRELVKTLQKRGTQIFLVSGGFRSLIEPAAERLGIPFQNIYANHLKFFYNGNRLTSKLMDNFPSQSILEVI